LEHGAIIDVESTKDEGTTFSIGFPLIKADQTDQSS
jgi:signal transduction histidine kinase